MQPACIFLCILGIWLEGHKLILGKSPHVYIISILFGSPSTGSLVGHSCLYHGPVVERNTKEKFIFFYWLKGSWFGLLIQRAAHVCTFLFCPFSKKIRHSEPLYNQAFKSQSLHDITQVSASRNKTV